MISFLQPWFLVGIIPFTAFLVWAYRRISQGQRITVSSLFLLEQMKSPARARKRFKPPWRFFLELLALLLLATAAAGLSFQPSEKPIAILVDNSMSMAAQDQLNQRTTRLEAAKVLLQQYLRRSPAGRQYRLFESSPELREVGRGLLGEQRVRELVKEISVQPVPDRLESVISELQRTANAESLVIFSDRPLEGSRADVEGYQTAPDPIRPINVAVQEIRFQSGGSGESGSLEVSLRNFGSVAADGVVSVHRLSIQPGANAESLARNVDVSVEADSERTVSFGNLDRGELFRVSWRSSEDEDVLSLDNEGWFSAPSRGETIGVVSGEPLPKLGLDRLPNAAFESTTAAEAASFRTVLLHRSPMLELPGVNIISILPREGALGLQFVGNFSSGSKLWSKSSSELLRYLDLRLLSVQEGVLLGSPAWAEPILESERGTLALAGETGGRRVAVFGFELLPYVGRSNPAGSILLLNTLKWTRGGEAAADRFTLGKTFLLREDEQRATLEWEGGKESLSPGERIGRRGIVVVAGEDSRSFYPVGSSFPMESKIHSPEPIQVSPVAEQESPIPSARELTEILIWIVLVLVLLDLLFTIRPRESARAV